MLRFSDMQITLAWLLQVFSCQNHVRAVVRMQDRLFVCTTGAYSPAVYHLDVTMDHTSTSTCRLIVNVAECSRMIVAAAAAAAVVVVVVVVDTLAGVMFFTGVCLFVSRITERSYDKMFLKYWDGNL